VMMIDESGSFQSSARRSEHVNPRDLTVAFLALEKWGYFGANVNVGGKS